MAHASCPKGNCITFFNLSSLLCSLLLCHRKHPKRTEKERHSEFEAICKSRTPHPINITRTWLPEFPTVTRTQWESPPQELRADKICIQSTTQPCFRKLLQGVVVHVFTPNTHKAEAGGARWVWGQLVSNSGLARTTCQRKKKDFFTCLSCLLNSYNQCSNLGLPQSSTIFAKR